MAEHDIEKSLVNVLGESPALDIAADVGEHMLDEILTNGPLKDIPFFGSLLKLWRAGSHVKDYLFARKVSKLLAPLATIPEKDRQEFVDRLNRDPKFKQRVGEHLLMVIDRLDDMGKPELVARALKAYILGRINFESFQRLTFAVDRCFITDLPHLKDTDRPASYPQVVAMNLSACGILEVATIPSIRAEGVRNQYSLTDLGRLLLDVVLRGP